MRDRTEAYESELLESIRKIEGICIRVWGEIHDREGVFRNSIDHFLWGNSRVIFEAALLSDGYVFINFDNCDEGTDEREGPKTLSLSVNCNDFFQFACSDSVPIDPKSFWLNFVRVRRGDKHAFERWAAKERGAEPLSRNKARMDAFYSENPTMLGPMPCTLTDQERPVLKVGEEG